MKNFIFCLLAIVAMCGIAACSTDDDPANIELSTTQSSKVKLYADQTSGNISFTAPASWSAWVSPTSRAGVEIDWLKLNTTSGSAGDISLSFTLDRNDTGSSRTAFIIIVCGDERLSFEITQTAEANGNTPTSGPRLKFANAISSAFPLYRILDYDGNLFSYESAFENESGAEVVSMITGNDGKCIFNYSDDLIAEDSYGRKWIITLGGGTNHNYATRIQCFNGEENVSFVIDYNGNYPTKFIQYKNGKVDETSELTWQNGDITSVKTTFNGGSTTLVPKYSDVENICNLMLYDTQLWVDLNETQLFYFLGILGNGTKHLITSSTTTEIDGGQTYKFSSRFDYSFDSKNRPVKMVYTETEDGEGSSTDVAEFMWKDVPQSN